MEIKTNGKRNVKLPETNGKKRIVLKDINGDVVSYIKTGKNSGRITGVVPDVVYAEVEEIPLRQVNMGALNIAKTLDLTDEINLILEKQNTIRQAFGAVLDFKAKIEDKFLKNKEQTDVALIELAEVAKNIGLINNERYEELKSADLSQNIDIKKIYSLCRDLSSRAGFVESEVANITAILASHEHEKQTKESIGLGNVDNTSDIEKPVSVAVQMALDDKVSKEELKEFSEYIMSIKKRQNEIENGIQSLGGICANPIPNGGHEGQVLMKRSDLDGDYWWSNTAGTEPATEEKAGVAKIATEDEARLGNDDTKIMTPAKVNIVLSEKITVVNAEIDANADAILKTRNDLQSEIDENKSQINELKTITTTIRSDLDDLGDQLSGIEEKIPDTASSSNQLADKNFVNEKVKEIKESLGNVYKFKGSVDTYADLPTAGMEIGDVYNVIDTEKNYAWDGNRWDDIGGTIDLSLYAKKEDIPSKTSDLINDLDFITSEAVKNTVKLLDDEHKNILLANGTYDGKDVEDGFVFTSPDGKLVGFDKTLNPGGDWYSVTLPTRNPSSGSNGGPYDGVCWGNGVFVAVNQYLRSSNTKTYSYVATSTNGKDWVEHTNALDWTPSTFTDARNYFKVLFANGLFFMPDETNGSQRMAVSGDGQNWSEITINTQTAGVQDIAYFKGKYIMSNSLSNSIHISDNYTNWTQLSEPAGIGKCKLAVSPNRIVAVKSDTYANQFYYSDNGVNWKSGTLLGNNYYQDIAYGKGKFVITTGTTSTNRNTILYSEDGVNWNTSTMPSSGGWTNVIYDETADLFIAVDGAYSSNVGAHSEDGINWTPFTRPQGVINRYGLTSGNGVIVAVPTNPSGTPDLTPRIFYANYTPFYEYGLTDLSFNKTEVEAKYALKSDVPTMTSQLTNDSDFATNAYVNGQIQDVRADFAESDTALQTQITGLSNVLDAEQGKIVSIENKIPTSASASNLLVTQTDLLNATQDVRADFAEADSELQTQINGQATTISQLDNDVMANISEIADLKLTIENKKNFTDLSMPSKTKYTDLTLGASGAIYTAPATGWFLIDKSGNDQEYVYIGSTSGAAFTLSSSGLQGICATIPVSKGEAISISYNASLQTNRFRFIYAIGEE